MRSSATISEYICSPLVWVRYVLLQPLLRTGRNFNCGKASNSSLSSLTVQTSLTHPSYLLSRRGVLSKTLQYHKMLISIQRNELFFFTSILISEVSVYITDLLSNQGWYLRIFYSWWYYKMLIIRFLEMEISTSVLISLISNNVTYLTTK